MKNILIGVAVLLIAAWEVLGVSSGSVLGVQTDSSVEVAGLFNQTGFAAFAGEASRNGFIMAIEDAGRNPADFVIEDAQSDLAMTVGAAQKLTAVDGADVIIGPEWAEFSEVVIPVAENAKSLVISPWMVSEGSSVSSDNYLSATPSERAQVRAVLARMNARKDKIALVYSKNAWALGLHAVVEDELKNFVDVVVVYETQHAADSVDYRSALTEMQVRGVTAIFAVVSAGAASEAFISQYRTLGVGDLYLPYSVYSQLVFAYQDDGLLNGVLFPAGVTYERTQEFNAKYKARFGAEPAAISAATAYDMTTLVLKAIDEGAQSAADVRAYLAQVNGYRGYSGVIEFGADGHVVPGTVELRQVTSTGSVVVQ